MKHFLVMLYPGFCNFEISALTEILAFQNDWEMTTVGAEHIRGKILWKFWHRRISHRLICWTMIC